ncbi:MAG TPA: family 10 glycosylhydrolase [Candidatus Eisenbacteria bacterium]|nr:family 10 glycosylhydrolase [Candidatus Eisenbacteria bacterium]
MRKTAAVLAAWMILVSPAPARPAAADARPARALFVSVIQDPPVLSGRDAIDGLVRYAVRAGVRTLFVQIYRENKAWFRSTVGDSSPYEACLASVGEDPLALLIRQAHASGIEVHAWLNLLSLGANEHSPLLGRYGTDILTRNVYEKKTLDSYKIDNQFFLDPGDERVREALSRVVGEVVDAYPELDGLQFDYIRYPDWHPAYGYNSRNVARYLEKVGRDMIPIENDDPSWQQWKRDQVTGLLELLAGEARSRKPSLRISTTGLVPYSRANLEAFQDWRTWLDRGLVDFVTLMGYSTSTIRFRRYLRDARDSGPADGLARINVAVGAYEMTRQPRTFRRQIEACREAGPRACVAFHYGSLMENPELAATFAGDGEKS